MHIVCSTKSLESLAADLVVCFAGEGQSAPLGVDGAIGRRLAKEMKADGFRGRTGDVVAWSSNGACAARRVLVLGLGKAGADRADALRSACARAAREADRWSARRLAIRLPPSASGASEADLRAATEGARFGAYAFERHLTDDSRRRTPLGRVELSAGAATAAVRRAMARGRRTADAVCLARDLVNEAPSRMNPTAMVREARRAAKAAGLQCTVSGPAQLRRAGLSALLAVARGSHEDARVVHLRYRPEGKPRRKVLLVGKGVTFDSGGLNLKPTGSMATMKMDMAGAAAVLATMTALGELGVKAEVHAYLGLVENLTGGNAYKPGDILETYAGKTVEVGNTDAEGRLVLADLLAYAVAKHKPTHVVDVATLTGACVVALGPNATGLFCRHDELTGELRSAAAAAGERFWPLPMYDEYLSMIQKGPADLNNTGGRWGGAITAALFLGEFVPRDVPWAHLDIAGPAFAEDDQPDRPVGGTGAAVATMLRWLEADGR